MADIVDAEKKKKSRRLPPLGHEEPADDGAAEEVKKPRRKKKKPAETTEESVPGGEGETPAEGDRPRRKKKKPVDQSQGELGDEATGELPPGETPRKKKRRKKKPADEDSAMNADEPEPEPAMNADGSEKLVKKKRRKRKTPRDSEPEAEVHVTNGRINEGLAAELYDMEDDVIDAGGPAERTDDEEEEDEDAPHKFSHQGPTSQPEDSLYIEKKTYFRREDKQKLARRLADEEELRKESDHMIIQPSQDTLQFALTTHRLFRKFSLICHGLLAGFSVTHSVLILLLIMNHPLQVFLDFYSAMSLPIHQIYYFLFLVCTVSASDRFDLAGMTARYFVKCITLQNGAISAVIYLAGTVLSLSVIHRADYIAHYTINSTQFTSDLDASKSFVNEWGIVSAVRAGLALVAWCVIALQPGTDKLASNLVEGEENLLGDNVQLNKINVSKA